MKFYKWIDARSGAAREARGCFILYIGAHEGRIT